jgi:hypothetical protein
LPWHSWELTNGRVDDALDLTVPEFCFGLTFKLWLGHANTDHRGQSLADIIPGRNEILVDTGFLPVGIDAPRQSRAKSRDVRAPFVRRNIIDVTVHILGELAGVLQRDIPGNPFVFSL